MVWSWRRRASGGGLASSRWPSRDELPWVLLTCGICIGWELIFARFFALYRFHTPGGHRLWGVADDVYISANFARTFAHGEGLLWYPGAPRVEGFSNPTWVLLMAVFHALPFYFNSHLGAYLGVVNALLIGTLGVCFARTVRRLVSANVPTPSLVRVALAVFVAVSSAISFCFCAAIGFETALVTLVAFAAFAEVLVRREEARLLRVALLVAFAVWSRLDAPVVCTGAIVATLVYVRFDRRLAAAAALCATLIGTSFVARHAYYGEWMPNTYYLKATGWPFRPRVAQGLFFAWVPVRLCGFLLLPAWALACRRWGRLAIGASLAIVVYALTLGYSVLNGGDIIMAFGQDRFTAMGVVFLAFGLVIAILRTDVHRALAPFAIAGLIVVALGPIWVPSPAAALHGFAAFLDLRRPALIEDLMVENWVDQAYVLKRITRPGARVALCGAGTLVYFSQRGGVDILGKIEPIVAHETVPEQPPREARCWRGFPGAGHNKEDLNAVFDARKPELSVVVPPRKHAREYVRITYDGMLFFARKKTKVVKWSMVTTEGAAKPGQ
jgi:hypothetical protein